MLIGGIRGVLERIRSSGLPILSEGAYFVDLGVDLQKEMMNHTEHMEY
jgi:hypothetical protein